MKRKNKDMWWGSAFTALAFFLIFFIAVVINAPMVDWIRYLGLLSMFYFFYVVFLVTFSE